LTTRKRLHNQPHPTEPPTMTTLLKALASLANILPGWLWAY
jgi:hypothetical protein